MNGGDFKWTFNNAVQDQNYAVIPELKAAIVNYKSTLIGFADGSTLPNGGGTAVQGGDGDPSQGDYTPDYGGGTTTGGTTAQTGTYVYGSAGDYFWTIAANEEATLRLISDGVVTFNSPTRAKYQNTKNVAKSDGSVVYSDKVGSIALSKPDTGTNPDNVAGVATFQLPDGTAIKSMAFYMARNGSAKYTIETSNDGTTWNKELEKSTKSGGVYEDVVTPAAPARYFRVTNASSGDLHIQGIKIVVEGASAGGDDADDDTTDDRSKDATADFTVAGEDIVIVSAYNCELLFDYSQPTVAITVAPAPAATIKSVAGATGQDGAYTIAAPTTGQTQTATFVIAAENDAITHTYTINITRAVDPATVIVPTGEFLY